MHNGMFATLEEVFAFYVKAEGRPAHRHPLITPLDLLTEQDQQDLLAFLRALSGTPLIVVPPPLPQQLVKNASSGSLQIASVRHPRGIGTGPWSQSLS